LPAGNGSVKRQPSQTTSDTAPDWLAGGGALGQMVRSLDWSATPLGPPELWPESLRSTLAAALEDAATYQEEREAAIRVMAIGGHDCAGTLLQDSTDRKRAETEVAENKIKLETVFASISDAVFISDAEGHFVDFNEAFVTFHKFRNKEDCAKTLAEYPGFLEVFFPDGEPAPLEKWAVSRALRGETASSAEYTLRRKDTGETWVGSYSFAPIRDGDGVIIGAVVSGRDVTERKLLEQQLRLHRDHLDELVQKRTAELESRNAQLAIEIGERKRSGQMLRSYAEEVQDLYDNAPCGYHSLDQNGVFVRINDTELNWLGYRRDEIIGIMNIVDLLSPQSAENFRVKFPAFLQQGKIGDLEAEMVRKDGTRFPVIVNAVSICDANGKYLMSRSTVFDSTERKRAEEERRRSEEKYRQIFNNAPFGIFQTALDGRFVGVNPTMARIFGYPLPEQMVGALHNDIGRSYVHPEQRARLIQRALATNDYIHEEVQCRRSDASFFIIDLYVRAVPGTDGTILEGFAIDISSRKETEEALQRSELQFRLMAETVGEVFWLTSPLTEALLYLSPAFEKIWGLSCADIYASPMLWTKTILPEDLPRVLHDLKEMSRGKAATMEYRIKRPDGTLRWISDRGYPHHDASGRVTYIAGVASDVTEHKIADEALRVSESKFRVIFNNDVYAICIFEIDSGKILDVNEAHLSLYGYSREELCDGMKASELSAEPDNAYASVQALSQASPTSVTLRYHRKKDGTVFPVEIVGGAYQWDGKKVMFGLVHDVSVRMKAEKTLKRYAQRLIVQEEDLRKHVSMELHDDIGQELTALGLNLAYIGNNLSEETQSNLRSTLQDSRLLTKEISRTVRNLMVDLRPTQLEDYGLAGAIRSYLDQYAQRTGLEVAVQIDRGFPRLTSKQEIALFRITQEALNNTAKYAAATKVTLSLSSERAKVRLCIADDGVGFEPGDASLQPTGSGWGLTIMRERAELVGGSFQLCTEVGAGTSIVIEIDQVERLAG
jgi:PAS domain S-box-containing protein